MFSFVRGGASWTSEGAVAIRSASAVISPLVTAGFRWDKTAHLWRRFTNGRPHLAASGVVVGVSNVVIQRTPYVLSNATDRSHTPVPEVTIVGSGAAVFLIDGQMAKGAWSKADVASPFVYTDAKGKPVSFVRGSTWVVLAPDDSVLQVES